MKQQASSLHKLYNKGCAVNTLTLGAFVDFAEQLGESRRGLAGRYVQEQQYIFDAVDADSMGDLSIAQRRVLPGYPEAGPQIQQIVFATDIDTFDHYDQISRGLHLTFSALTRLAIYNGLALEIEQSSFVPPQAQKAS